MKKFKDLYDQDVKKDLLEQFKYLNIHQIPKLEKIVLSMGVGSAAKNSKDIDIATNVLGLIAAQKPVICKAKKSNASFSLRAGMPIGCKVTLRKEKMFEFLERLILITLPRSRDFRGFSKKNFDGKGNFNFGIREPIFIEIDYTRQGSERLEEAAGGLNINIVTTAQSDEEAQSLLSGFYFPFK